MTELTPPAGYIQEPLLNELPVVVDGIGKYLTRNGKRVDVFEIKPHHEDGNAFSVKGRIEKMFRGKMTFSGFEIWHPSGRKLPLKECGLDIVSKE